MAGGGVAIRIRHRIADVERDIVLVRVRRVVDRSDLRHRIGAGGAVDGDGEDMGRALHHPQRAVALQLVGEAVGRARLGEREGQLTVAAGSAERAGGVDRVRIVPGAAGIAARKRIVVELDETVLADARRVVRIGDRQRRLRGVAVAVGQRVSEDFGRAARRALVRGIGVAAVGLDRQASELAVDDQIAARIEARVRIAVVVAQHRGQRRIVCTHRIGTRRARGRIGARHHVAGGDMVDEVGGVSVVARGRHVVDDVDGQRSSRLVAVVVGDHDREHVLGRVAARIVAERVAVGDLTVVEVDPGDRQRAEFAGDLLPHFGNGLAVNRDALEPVFGSEHDGTGVGLGAVAVVCAVAVGDFAGAGGLGAVADGKTLLIDGFGRIDRAGREVRRLDDDGRLAVDELVHLLEFGRRVAELGRRDEVAKRNARIERRDRLGEIAAAALRRAGRGLRFGIDQKRGEVRRRNLHVADHDLRDEYGAPRDHHLAAVGHVDDEVAPIDVDVRHLDAGGQVNDALSRGGGGDLADVDGQRGRRIVPARIRERVVEDVLDAVGRTRITDIAEVTLGIDRQRPILAGRLEGAVGEHGLAARSLHRDDCCGGSPDAVGA